MAIYGFYLPFCLEDKHMDIAKTQDGDSLTFALTGRLDTNTSPELEQALADSLEGCHTLVFDFAGLDYLSSAGLRVLLSA